MINEIQAKSFLITGVSSGFGRALAEAALNEGHTVIGTVRSEAARGAFEALSRDKAHAVVLDITDFSSIPITVAAIEERFGALDVLVNNAGYGHEGTLEESSLDELLRQFDVNVFGAVAMIKAVLPAMRKRRSGHIINITSMAGFVGLPGIPYYSASKFALEGLSEVLAKEVAGFGINVTAVAPGSFRTDWAGRSMTRTERSIADYDSLFEPVRRARTAKSGKQSGDPVKAARTILQLIAADNPPTHLLLGNDALRLVREKLTRLRQEIDAWEALTTSTDFS